MTRARERKEAQRPVKVMVVGPTDADSFADNLIDTLPRLGHTVVVAGPPRRQLRIRRLNNLSKVVATYAGGYDTWQQRGVVEAARDARPDLVVTVDVSLRPAVVEQLSRSAGQVVLWFPDAVA